MVRADNAQNSTGHDMKLITGLNLPIQPFFLTLATLTVDRRFCEAKSKMPTFSR